MGLFADIYSDCDMICDTRRNDHFYIITLFIDKHIKMIMVWFLQGCENKDVSFKSVEYDA